MKWKYPWTLQGLPLNNSLGFKHHPLEGAGIFTQNPPLSAMHHPHQIQPSLDELHDAPEMTAMNPFQAPENHQIIRRQKRPNKTNM